MKIIITNKETGNKTEYNNVTSIIDGSPLGFQLQCQDITSRHYSYELYDWDEVKEWPLPTLPEAMEYVGELIKEGRLSSRGETDCVETKYLEVLLKELKRIQELCRELTVRENEHIQAIPKLEKQIAMLDNLPIDIDTELYEVVCSEDYKTGKINYEILYGYVSGLRKDKDGKWHFRYTYYTNKNIDPLNPEKLDKSYKCKSLHEASLDELYIDEDYEDKNYFKNLKDAQKAVEILRGK